MTDSKERSFERPLTQARDFNAASTISVIPITASSSRVRPTSCRPIGASVSSVGSSRVPRGKLRYLKKEHNTYMSCKRSHLLRLRRSSSLLSCPTLGRISRQGRHRPDSPCHSKPSCNLRLCERKSIPCSEALCILKRTYSCRVEERRRGRLVQ